jgi:hypothetical protein
MVPFQWKISCLLIRDMNRVLQQVFHLIRGSEEPEVDFLRSFPGADPILTGKKAAL